MLKMDTGPSTKRLFGQGVVIIPILADKRKGEIKLFNVYCPEKKKRHWAFPAGDILRGVDTSLGATAKRIFLDEVGCCFDRTWEECFMEALPASMDMETAHVCNFVALEKDGFRYPARPHIFVQVTEDFYEATRAYEDASGIIKLPMPE